MSRYVVHLVGDQHPIVAEHVLVQSNGWLRVHQKLSDPVPGRPVIWIPPHRVEDVEDHGRQGSDENSD